MKDDIPFFDNRFFSRTACSPVYRHGRDKFRYRESAREMVSNRRNKKPNGGVRRACGWNEKLPPRPWWRIARGSLASVWKHMMYSSLGRFNRKRTKSAPQKPHRHKSTSSRFWSRSAIFSWMKAPPFPILPGSAAKTSL